jgi:23S rRNA (uridine2552-2'-O)-methyltransferase
MSFKVKDHFYKKAKKEKFLARSVFKLEEIDKKYNVLKKGEQILDLGYYPGSWVQYASKKIGEKGNVVGIDIQPINKNLENLKNVTLYEKDIFTVKSLEDLGMKEAFDVVLSDMAPKTTGIKTVDQDRSLALVENVFESLDIFLKKGGNFIIKVFDSQDAQNFLKNKKGLFKTFSFLKPKSTRSVSKEFFVIGKDFNNENKKSNSGQ